LRTLALAATLLAATGLGGCLKSTGELITGSIPSSAATDAPRSEAEWRREAQALGKRYEANRGEKSVSLAYARALRQSGQVAQAVAVIESAMIKAPQDKEILAAYGRVLVDAGRHKQALDVLSRAHAPDRPDWRLMSTMGVAADSLGEHAMAQNYYRTALKIAPQEPSILSNLGLSLALSRNLREAEAVMRQAAAHPRADAQVRQNLVLVLGLQGKFDEAERVARQDLSPVDAASNIEALRKMVSQSGNWNTIRAGGKPQAGAKPKAKPTQG
jgi:Flp pilus assembly protein TadD